MLWLASDTVYSLSSWGLVKVVSDSVVIAVLVVARSLVGYKGSKRRQLGRWLLQNVHPVATLSLLPQVRLLAHLWGGSFVPQAMLENQNSCVGGLPYPD